MSIRAYPFIRFEPGLRDYLCPGTEAVYYRPEKKKKPRQGSRLPPPALVGALHLTICNSIPRPEPVEEIKDEPNGAI